MINRLILGAHKVKNLISKKKGNNNFDEKLKKYLNYESGYFIELGANDGLRQSNTYYLEKKLKWSGILIEPALHNYISLISNRSKNNKFFCAACVSVDFTEKFVHLIYADLMTLPKVPNSDILDIDKHLESREFLKIENESFVEFGAIAKTLTQILEQSNAPKLIDFLSLDVEGGEIEVLNGVDFTKYNFKFILIESRNFENTNNFLSSRKYNLIEEFSKQDLLFEFDPKSDFPS